MDKTKQDWEIGISPAQHGVYVQCMGCGVFIEGHEAHYKLDGPAFVFYHERCKPTEIYVRYCTDPDCDKCKPTEGKS